MSWMGGREGGRDPSFVIVLCKIIMFGTLCRELLQKSSKECMYRLSK